MKLEKYTQLKSQRFTYQVRGTFHVTPVSIIYKAKMIGDNEQEASEVVIKQTSKIFGDGQEEMSRMIQDLAMKEIKTLKNIKNKNVVGYIDDFENDHSVYLVMEFCNSLDLGVLLKSKTNLKKHKAFVELEAIGIIKQILNGLKGLHQNLVIHRNLEISNILVQNPGTIIKLTGLKRCQQRAKIDNNYDSLDTIAPEVILKKKYGLSVDIFAVGCLLYQLIFGKLPFPTNSKEEYIKAIKDEQISWDSQISMSPECKKLIQNMLKFNPNERITFVQIYSHPFFKDYCLSNIGVDSIIIQANQDNSVENQQFYDDDVNPEQVKKTQKLDQVLFSQNEKQNQYIHIQFPMQAQSAQKQEVVVNNNKLSDEDVQRQTDIKAMKRNANRILHERNIYVFLASVAEKVMDNNTIENFDIVSFLLVKKLLQLIDFLKTSLMDRQNVFKLEYWDSFIQTKDYKDIQIYIAKEYDIFKVFFDSIYKKIMQTFKVRSGKIEENLRSAINNNYKQNTEKVMVKALIDYCREFIGNLLNGKASEQIRIQFIHADRVLDCIKLEETFQFDDKNTNQQFNFKQYYEQDNQLEIESLQKQVIVKLDRFRN